MDQPLSVTKPECHHDDATAIVRRLRESGHVAYFAGGCVRDLLLEKDPKDYDVATDAPPDRVRKLFSNTQAVGAAFGVVLVRHGRSVVEVATFRSDGTYEDGRRPSQVTFTTAENDARRRDFTINGLFLDPLTGDLIDFVGGRTDLNAKVVRAIGNPDCRFAEDHLRLLRAVRFAARLGFRIEPATANAIKSHAQYLKRISPERVGDELRQILTPASRISAWDMLWRLDLVPVIFRFLPPRTAPHQVDQDVFSAVHGESISVPLSLAAAAMSYLTVDLRKELPEILKDDVIATAGRGVRQALRISNEELDGMAGILSAIRPLLLGPLPSMATLKRFLAKPVSSDGRHLLNAIARVGYAQARVADIQPQLTSIAVEDVAPPPLITGDDLTAIGLRPGPAFKRILDQVYDAQLDGSIATKDDALRIARDVAAH